MVDGVLDGGLVNESQVGIGIKRKGRLGFGVMEVFPASSVSIDFDSLKIM